MCGVCIHSYQFIRDFLYGSDIILCRIIEYYYRMDAFWNNYNKPPTVICTHAINIEAVIYIEASPF